MSEMLNRHTINSPPFRIKVLDLEDVKLSSEYLVWNFYSFYEQYFHAFSKKELINIKSGEVEFGKMPMNLPLDSGKMLMEDVDPVVFDMY